VIPSLRELNELRFLGGFNVGKFMLLGRTDVILLPCDFFFKKLIEFRGSFSCLSIVSLFFTLATVFF
jgi:hypothetical protein